MHSLVETTTVEENIDYCYILSIMFNGTEMMAIGVGQVMPTCFLFSISIFDE